MPADLYRALYPTAERWLLEQVRGRLVHGSELTDFFHERIARGRFAVDVCDEMLLRELVDAGLIVPVERAPTPSQAAFAGLQYKRGSYHSQPLMTAGLVAHNYFARGPKLSTTEVVCAG